MSDTIAYEGHLWRWRAEGRVVVLTRENEAGDEVELRFEEGYTIAPALLVNEQSKKRVMSNEKENDKGIIEEEPFVALEAAYEPTDEDMVGVLMGSSLTREQAEAWVKIHKRIEDIKKR